MSFSKVTPKTQRAYDKITVPTCRAILTAFLGDFWAESGMVGNIMMSAT